MMEINSRIFGQICIDDSKVLHFVNGIVGFPQLTEFALPVVNPLVIMSEYNPQVEDELLKPLGNFENDDMLVLVTVTVPSDLTKMSVNLQGPIVINAATKKACQIIAEGYDVKYPIYELLKSRKAGE